MKRPPMAHTPGSRMSTGCPSATPSGLALGPPNLRLTNIAGEPLGFRRTGFSPVLALLMPAFSLVYAPPVLPLKLHCIHNAPLPFLSEFKASGIDFSPLTLSAQDHIRPVSYYALFKGWLLPSQPPGCLRDLTSFHT